MKLLVLGGTRFLGRHVVAAALARGDQVTIFHRGRTEPALFPECEHVLGDRDTDLARLDGRSWDAVVDTCGFVPRVVDLAVRTLGPRIGHYVFVSSISVYRDPVPVGADETAPLASLDDPATEEVTGATYGALKAACERAAEAALPGRVTSVRAGLLVGPWDYTDRFPYWVRRLVEGGDVLVPDAASQPLQLIDARDLADWILGAIERRASGPFNLTGPAEPLTFGGCLDTIQRALASSARRIPVPAAFLGEQKVAPWSELPLWVPEVDGFLSVSLARARAAGLAFRPLEATVRDTWDWIRQTGGPAGAGSTILASPPPASLTREREQDLLAAWAARGVSAPPA